MLFCHGHIDVVLVCLFVVVVGGGGGFCVCGGVCVWFCFFQFLKALFSLQPYLNSFQTRMTCDSF